MNERRVSRGTTSPLYASRLRAGGGHLTPVFDELFDFWDALSDLAVQDSDAGIQLCLERISHWIKAGNAFWVGAVRVLPQVSSKPTDPMLGWRVRATYHSHTRYHDPALTEKVEKATEFSKGVDPGAASVALASGAGRFRAYALQSGQLIDPQAFQQTDHFELFYRRWGIVDRIWVGFPVSPDAESFFCFDRIDGSEFFKDEELDLAALALRGIKWFHREVLLGYGLLLCEHPVTAAERRVIQGLLSGASEKQLASELGLSQGTVHQYATRIYRKFGVRGRAQFTGIWLNGSLDQEVPLG